jgi:hypothetical protein
MGKIRQEDFSRIPYFVVRRKRNHNLLWFVASAGSTGTGRFVPQPVHFPWIDQPVAAEFLGLDLPNGGHLPDTADRHADRPGNFTASEVRDHLGHASILPRKEKISKGGGAQTAQ